MIPPAISGWVLRLLLFAAGVVALFATGAYIGWTKRGDSEAKKTLAAQHKAEAIRRAVEDSWQKAHWNLAYEAEEKRAAREQATKDTLAGLRDGTLRVRDKFVCPKMPRDPSTPAQPDAEEHGFRAEDAGVAIGIADEADGIADELNQCIASYNALRAK